MTRKIQAIIAFMIILVISSTLCFDEDDGKKDPQPQKEWWDLEKFNDFIDQNYEVTYKKEAGSSIIQDVSEPESALYIAIGIDEAFTGLEIEALHYFVESGGNIIIAADNHTTVNPLATKFGLEYSEYRILDRNFDNNPAFIHAIMDVGNDSFVFLIHSPLGLEVEDDVNYKILAQSSEVSGKINSALDTNGDVKISGDDKPGPIPFMIEVTINDGRALFISDAGMFTNDLWHVLSTDVTKYPGIEYENDFLISELIYDMYTPGSTIIYDTSKQKAGFSNFNGYPSGEDE